MKLHIILGCVAKTGGGLIEVVFVLTAATFFKRQNRTTYCLRQRYAKGKKGGLIGQEERVIENKLPFLPAVE